VRALIALVVIGAVGGAAAVADPAPDPGEAAYRAAEAKLAAHDVKGAIDAFVAVADDAPGSLWADDALALAARGAEDTGQLARAVTLYRRIVAQYPSGNQARRAEAQLAALAVRIGPHGEWADVDAEHERILDEAAGHPEPRAELAALEALVAAHPDYPRATAARLWIGDTHLRLGDRAIAERWYRDAEAHAATPGERFYAGKKIGNVLLAEGDYDGAEAAYRALRPSGPVDAQAVEVALADVASARGRARLALWALVFVLAVLGAGVAVLRRDAGSWRAAARALARPPIEVWYAAPIAVLLVALAWRNDPLFGRAVAWTVAGGLVLAWLSGASLDLVRARAGRVPLARAAAHGAAAIAAVAAIAYVVLLELGILDLIIETWQNGHDH
jgi:tetratricopeptide (TPR) repeat protein